MSLADQLHFDEAEHVYTMAGKRLPSVTQILAPIIDYSGVPAHILAAAANRGVAVHKATELYDADTLDWTTVSDEILPYLEAWINFRTESGIELVAREVRTYHPGLQYAGTIDVVGRIRGKLCIADIKSCRELMPSAGPQTAGYMDSWNQTAEEKATHRYGIHLKSDGTYELVPLKNMNDKAVFMACYLINKFNEANK